MTPSRPVSHPLPLAKGDIISSWDFQGVYTDKPELVAKAQDEIARLSGLLAAATSSKMILLVGIANQYELLGKGKEQYDYLGRAVRTDAASSLPWHNLGVLMERFGAYQTARIAYEKATTLQPQFSFYHFAYLEFLTARMKDDTVDIEKAFAAAEANLGKVSYLLELRTAWENS
jgi:tetratricopeptide (TPR) repeat protein